jgi:hypothetical protein
VSGVSGGAVLKAIGNRLSLFALVLLNGWAHLHGQFSHPPLRPLPEVSATPMAEGRGWFVDGKKGDDNGQGSKDSPWKTVNRAIHALKPGDTLYLRDGIYHERVSAEIRGSGGNPITIRSYPGELAVIDGGFAEFWDSPETAWEPVVDGAPGEFRSKSVFPNSPCRKDSTNLLGNFGDSMVPLHGYRFLTDLRSDKNLFRNMEGDKTAPGNGLYCGPGVFLHPKTQRIHIRLAHTNHPALPEGDNYKGETDPRKLKLVIADGSAPAFELRGAFNVILRDLVFRGSCSSALNIAGCGNITMHGVTFYGGSASLRAMETNGIQCVDCAFRGIAAPWSWRWSLKYRSIEAKLVSASPWNPTARGNQMFRFSHCEFTDSVDGVFLGNVLKWSVSNCLMDNVSDDGFFLTCTAGYDGHTNGNQAEISQNRISRVLTVFAFGVGHGRQRTENERGDKNCGGGVDILGNMIDLQDPVLYQEPDDGPVQTFGRVVGDHGSPAWAPMVFKENFVRMRGSPWRNYYGAGLARGMGKGTVRRIESNVFIHEEGNPGQVMPSGDVEFFAKDNVHWSAEVGSAGAEEFLRKFRQSEQFAETKWAEGDTYPINEPEVEEAWDYVQVGLRGRFKLTDGLPSKEKREDRLLFPNWRVQVPEGRKSVALVKGYPAFDGQIVEFALEKAGYEVEVFDQEWLPVSRLGEYVVVVYMGSTTRAKMEPSGFSEADYQMVQEYLDGGGKIVVGRELERQLFPGDAGKKFWGKMNGKPGLLYIGWEVSKYLPSGRKPATVGDWELYLGKYAEWEKLLLGVVE